MRGGVEGEAPICLHQSYRHCKLQTPLLSMEGTTGYILFITWQFTAYFALPLELTLSVISTFNMNPTHQKRMLSENIR